MGEGSAAYQLYVGVDVAAESFVAALNLLRTRT